MRKSLKGAAAERLRLFMFPPVKNDYFDRKTKSRQRLQQFSGDSLLQESHCLMLGPESLSGRLAP